MNKVLWPVKRVLMTASRPMEPRGPASRHACQKQRLRLERYVQEGKIAFERQGARIVEPLKIRECIVEHAGRIKAVLAAPKLLKTPRQT